MARVINMSAIPTAHPNGTLVTIINQVIFGGRRFATIVKYIPTRNGAGQTVILPNAAMQGRTWIPEPLFGAGTVTIESADSTAWTAGN